MQLVSLGSGLRAGSVKFDLEPQRVTHYVVAADWADDAAAGSTEHKQ
jgi:hypothetical protein